MTTDEGYAPTTIFQATLLHWIFFGIATVIILLAFGMNTGGPKEVFMPGMTVPLPESCGAKNFGLSCPGCGLTRSFIHIAHGRFMDAWRMNPAGFLVFCFVAAQIPWQLFQIVRIRKGKREVKGFWIYLPIIVCTVGLVLQWLFRISQGIII